jgi:hypothetical protein
MKIVTIICLLIATAVLGFLLYENSRQPAYKGFPVEKNQQSVHQVPFFLYLYIFFKPEDNPGSLEIIPELNRLPAHFKIIGVVPDRHLEAEDRLRRKTGATFPLTGISRFKKYEPFYTPTIAAISEKGNIFFVKPIVAGEKESFKRFLYIFYQNIYPSLLKEKK